MSLLFQKIKCILCENTKPNAKLMLFCQLFKFLFCNCLGCRILYCFCADFQKVCDNKSETFFYQFSVEAPLFILSISVAIRPLK